MNNASSLILLFAAHFLGDYYFQSKRMVLKKEKGSFLAHGLHALIYSLPIFLVCLCLGEWWLALITSLCVGLSHFAVDYSKYLITKRELNDILKVIVFVLDQIIHIAILVCVSCFFYEFNAIGESIIVNPVSKLGLSASLNNFLFYVLSFLFLMQPANVINRFILDTFFKQKTSDARAGSMIGVLERLTMYSFSALLGWYAILPVVLTAKTFARFERFKGENGDVFAEKYIVGTLLSTAYVGACLVIGLVVK